MASPQDLVVALSRAFTLSGTLPSGDAGLSEALTAVRELQVAVGWQVIRLEGDGFTVNQQFVVASDEELVAFQEALASARVSEIRLQDPLEPDLLQEFLLRLGPERRVEGVSGAARFRGLEEVVGLSFGSSVGPVLGMAGSVQALFQPADGAPGAPGIDAEGFDAGPGFDQTSEVGSLVASFLAARGQERVQLREAIAAAAARFKEARDLGALADMVEYLCDGSDLGRKDPEALEIATGLTTTGVASQLVVRLGTTRDEGGRARLGRIATGLGREMALALADALGEARDRFQRRSFMDALVAQGDLAREMAEKMVVDPRWYVVRNGVALLGEMRGEGAVSHLTMTLANPDARVRKETVLALAKQGGEDASMLVLGMLDDPAPDVRAKACSAVGILKVDRALRTLLTLLEDDSHEEVQIQALQALGQIADPGAVPLIEKKAVGRFFSRPSKEIRLAAYRALAGIGTPHARLLLQKAAKDSDRDVRKLALGLME